MGRSGPAIVWGTLLVVFGVVLLVGTLGIGRVELGTVLATWWPAILIAFGVAIIVEARWPGRRPADTLSLDLAGASTAEVRIDFGGGRLTVVGAPAGKLVDGTFLGGVHHRLAGPGQVRLWADAGDWWWRMGWRGFDWQVGLARDVPLTLEIHCGASQTDLDLTDVRLASLFLSTGAAETRVRLPRAGSSTVRIEAGVAAVRLFVPQGVAARIRSSMALGTTDVDARRFPRGADGWASPDFASVADRIDIAVNGGMGSVTVA